MAEERGGSTLLADAFLGNLRAGDPRLKLTDKEMELAIKLWSATDLCGMTKFPTWMADRTAMQGMSIPISQITGFAGYTAQSAFVEGWGDTKSTSYVTTLSHPSPAGAATGPEITGLAPGKYLVFVGCASSGDDILTAFMSFSVNGATASDDTAALLGCDGTPGVGYNTSIARAVTVDLTESDNTLTAAYRNNRGGTSGFANRWLTALLYGSV